ncbi:MAG: M4 family metallopeptidase, partial [Calditrichia bacterium]
GAGSGSWRLGEDITASGLGIRNMANPNEFGDPDTYGGTNWFNVVGCTPSNLNDQCGVHTNSGVQNFWFYLLSEGGSGTNDNGDPYNVTGIGTADAAAIAYRNLTVYLTTSSEYADARTGAIAAATDLFGPGSPQVQATMDAWDAVGVYAASPPSGILVWEGILGGQDYSGAYINTFLTNAGFATQYTDVFPPSLIGYDAVFLSFGNFGTTSGDPYTPFNNTMAAAVQQYLEAGGKVYLEGGDALGFDQSGNTTLQNLFGLSSVTDGSATQTPITALAGQSGAITNGMLFTASTQVDNIYIDYFTPNTGVVAFNEPTVGDVAVQNSGSFGQKSFCFSYALAELTDGTSPSTKDDLMAAIVNFFGLQLPAPEIAVSPTSFNFTVPFEGGDSDLLTISNIAPAGYPDLLWNILDLDGTVVLENGQILPVTFQPLLDGKYQVIKPPSKSPEFYSMHYQSRLTEKFTEASKSPGAVDVAEKNNGNAVVKLDPQYLPNSGFRSTLLYNNGPLINSPGTGVGGADESVLQTTSLGMITL